jgi:hypothetical protein
MICFWFSEYISCAYFARLRLGSDPQDSACRFPNHFFPSDTTGVSKGFTSNGTGERLTIDEAIDAVQK